MVVCKTKKKACKGNKAGNLYLQKPKARFENEGGLSRDLTESSLKFQKARWLGSAGLARHNSPGSGRAHILTNTLFDTYT